MGQVAETLHAPETWFFVADVGAETVGMAAAMPSRENEGAGDLVCTVGREMRDYVTLIEALRPLEIPCHIAAGTAINYDTFGTEDEQAANVGGRALPASVTVGRSPWGSCGPSTRARGR